MIWQCGFAHIQSLQEFYIQYLHSVNSLMIFCKDRQEIDLCFYQKVKAFFYRLEEESIYTHMEKQHLIQMSSEHLKWKEMLEKRIVNNAWDARYFVLKPLHILI